MEEGKKKKKKKKKKEKKKIRFFSKVFLCCRFLIFLLQNIEFF
jgi:hypothetical protein